METNWAVATSPASTDVIDYLRGFELTSTENKEEDFIIGGGRAVRGRRWLNREVSGALDFEPCSGRMFYAALGSIAGAGGTGESTTLPCTIGMETVLPSFTIKREIRYPGEAIQSSGLKIDRLEMNIDEGGPVVITCDLAGQSYSIPIYTTLTPDIDFSATPYGYQHSSIDIIMNSGATTNVDHMRNFRLEIRNNLEAIFSPGKGSLGCTHLKERGLEITGRMLFDYPFATFATDILGRTENTLKVTLAGATQGTVVLTISDVAFEGFPDAIRGMDMMQLDLPFVARQPSSTGSIITITQGSISGATVLSDLAY